MTKNKNEKNIVFSIKTKPHILIVFPTVNPFDNINVVVN